MFSKIKHILSSSTKVVYPDKCPFCNELIDNNQYACDNCKKDIPTHGELRGVHGGYRCVSTLVHSDKHRYALLQFKFNGKTQFAKQFAMIMYEEVKRSYPDMVFDVITYVPMHKVSELFRGYNQCELLAKHLSSLMNTPYKKLIEKKKYTRPQHKLRVKDRTTNLKGAFKVIDKNEIKGKTILIIDDIVTTGSTLAECTKTLEKAKPINIYCLTISRAQNS